MELSMFAFKRMIGRKSAAKGTYRSRWTTRHSSGRCMLFGEKILPTGK